MGKHSRKCHDVAAGLPGGLTAESFIDTAGGNCLIRASEKGDHVIKIQNRTLLRFRIDVSAECESAHLQYSSQQATWAETIEIYQRPRSGGARERRLSKEIVGTGEAEDRSVKMTISYQIIGCMGVGSATVQLQVDIKQ